MAGRILWFSAKAGILGGTIYYTNNLGIWGDSRQTTKLLEDTTKFIAPYINQNAPAIKTQAQSLPSMAEISASTKALWNRSVLKSTLFLSSLPTRIVDWSKSGVDFISQQLQQIEGKKEGN